MHRSLPIPLFHFSAKNIALSGSRFFIQTAGLVYHQREALYIIRSKECHSLNEHIITPKGAYHQCKALYTTRKAGFHPPKVDFILPHFIFPLCRIFCPTVHSPTFDRYFCPQYGKIVQRGIDIPSFIMYNN